MSRDANQIAREYERREPGFNRQDLQPPPPAAPKPQHGTFSIWEQISDMLGGVPPLTQFEDVVVNVGVPGQIITTDLRGARAIYYPRPGMYCEFVPNAEG